MTKTEFLEILRQKLSRIPAEDAERSIAYYGEMLDDCMEDGMSEEEAVACMGDLDEIVSQIVADLPMGRLVKQKMRPRRKMRAWEIVLLVLGSPIWLSLLVAPLSVIISLFAVLFSLLVTLWAMGAVFAGCAIGAIGYSVLMFAHGFAAQGLWMVGGGLVLGGLSILWYFLSRYATRGFILLVKMPFVQIKKALAKGEDENV